MQALTGANCKSFEATSCFCQIIKAPDVQRQGAIIGFHSPMAGNRIPDCNTIPNGPPILAKSLSGFNSLIPIPKLSKEFSSGNVWYDSNSLAGFVGVNTITES